MGLLYFRKLRLDDIAALVELEAAATAYPWSRTALQQSIEAGHTGYVCCKDPSDIPLAYAVTHTVLDETSLLNICVGREFRGRGLGRGLLSHLIDIARQAGAMRMLLEVRASNTSAIHLYETLGFVRDGTRKGYYRNENGKEDALLYSLSLEEGGSASGGE